MDPFVNKRKNKICDINIIAAHTKLRITNGSQPECMIIAPMRLAPWYANGPETEPIKTERSRDFKTVPKLIKDMHGA